VTILSTKKTIVFLSAILICFSSFGMKEGGDGNTIFGSIQNSVGSTFNGINNGINSMILVPSNLVISKATMKKAVAASLLPAVIGGGAAILNYNGYDVSLPEDKRVLAGVALLPVATYLFTRNLTVTPQFKRHCDAQEKILEMHPIMRQQELLERLLKENTKESNDKLEEWLIAAYRPQIGNSLCSRVVLQEEVNKLAAAIETELQRMQAMKKVSKEPEGDGVNREEMGEKYSKYPIGSAKHLKAEKDLVARLLARIIKFLEYTDDADRAVKIDGLNHKKQAEFGYFSMIKPLLGHAAVSVILLALLKAIGDKFGLSIDWTGLQQMLRPITLTLEKAVLIQPIDLAQ